MTQLPLCVFQKPVRKSQYPQKSTKWGRAHQRGSHLPIPAHPPRYYKTTVRTFPRRETAECTVCHLNFLQLTEWFLFVLQTQRSRRMALHVNVLWGLVRKNVSNCSNITETAVLKTDIRDKNMWALKKQKIF